MFVVKKSDGDDDPAKDVKHNTTLLPEWYHHVDEDAANRRTGSGDTYHMTMEQLNN